MSLCGTDKRRTNERTIEDRATQPLDWKAEFRNLWPEWFPSKQEQQAMALQKFCSRNLYK